MSALSKIAEKEAADEALTAALVNLAAVEALPDRHGLRAAEESLGAAQRARVVAADDAVKSSRGSEESGRVVWRCRCNSRSSLSTASCEWQRRS